MSDLVIHNIQDRPKHGWLKKVNVTLVRGTMTPLLESTCDGLLRHFRRWGHQVQDPPPDEHTDIILTTTRFGEALDWRDGLMFVGRHRYKLPQSPTVFTLVHARPGEFNHLRDHLQQALAKQSPDLADFDFPGLAPKAHRVLLDQGRRGGAMLSLLRILQAQTKCVQVVLLVGDETPLCAYYFDLVGAHPATSGEDLDALYSDSVLRMVTRASTREVTEHVAVGDPISQSLWESLETPEAMCQAGHQLGKRSFFTEMLRISDLVHVPAISDAISSQYSEGCFATWDPVLGALITTATGSARPVDKDSITENELAVIVGVRPDAKGVLIRSREGVGAVRPSSEAVEMMEIDLDLPEIDLDPVWEQHARVPVARSKLHGHRGVASYDPRYIEYVSLDPAYHYYPVSCSTGAQARGIKDTFSRSHSLADPSDPRQLVFTLMPGHGIFIVEKWVPGTQPFQAIWERMDDGGIEVVNRIPQGPMEFVPTEDGRMTLHELPL